MDAVELLKRMRELCKIKCWCSLSTDSADNLLLMWRGDIKTNKDGDKKDWYMDVTVDSWQLRRNPRHLDMCLDDAERRIALLLKGIAEGVE